MQQVQQRSQEIHLLDYWRIINSKRHIVVSFFTLVVGIVTVYSFAATPVYQSTAKLLVNQENNTTLTFAEGAPQIQIKDPAEYYNTQKKILFSRTFIDRVVRKYSLDTNPYFTEKKRKATSGVLPSLLSFVSGIVSRPRGADVETINRQKEEADPWLTSLLLAQMKVDLGRDSSIMDIHFSSDNPGIAASVANGIAETYIEYNLDLRLTPYRNSVEWLTSRLSELKLKVENSENSLQKYKEQKGIISQEAKESILTQKLQGLVAEMVKSQAARQDAEVRYNQIREVVDRPELLATVPDIMNNQVIQGLRNEELKLKQQQSELSGKYGPKHPQMVKANSELESVRRNLVSEARKMLNSAKTEYEIALNREKFLNRSVEAEKKEVLGVGREMIDLKVVSEESENNRRFYEMLLKKLQEATLLSGVTFSNIQIIDHAIPAGSPLKPDRMKNILLAVVIGLFGGVFLAIFADYMDDSMKSQDDVELHLGQHFLGMVPAVQDTAVFADLQSPVNESYRTIRMGLKFAASQRPIKTILVTSAIPGEGKTTTSTNLAVMLANMGDRVLLVDADLRRQSVHKLFGMESTTGLGSIVLGQAELFSTIKPVEGHPGLSVLTAGPAFPNPAEVLSSERAREVLAALRDKYDLIIIDSPPILPVSDPLILSEMSDGVIIVTKGGSTSRVVAWKACQSLATINAKIIGVVMNNVRVPKGVYGSYYYSYYRPYGEARKETA
jgi:capsular exopolysaccharide synthesis family protein